MRPLFPALSALSALAIAASAAAAHEFWILPGTFHPRPNAAFPVFIHHGERLAGVTVPRNDDTIRRFELRTLPSEDGAHNGARDDSTVAPVVGLSASPRSFAKNPAQTGAVLIYESEWMPSILPAKKFNAYLEEEGLTQIAAWRARAGETHAEGRERYRRCAKALISSRDPDTETDTDDHPRDTPVGLPCEIVIVRTSADAIHARVLFEGEPLRGIEVVAANQTNPTDLQRTTTDSEGLARFDHTHPDTWLITTLYMRAADAEPGNHQPGSTPEFDWESNWASTVFSTAAAHTNPAQTN